MMNQQQNTNPIEEVSTPDVKKINLDSNHDPDKTKKRLQKKLANKKQAAVIKKED